MKIITVNSIKFIFTEKPPLSITKNPLAKSEVDMKDVFLGLGGLIILFLFIVAIKLLKRSKTSNRTHVIPIAQDNDNRGHASIQQPQGSGKHYDAISETGTTNQPYQPLEEAKYEVINDNVRLTVPISPKTSNKLKQGTSNPLLNRDIDNLNIPVNDDLLEEKTKKSDYGINCLEKNLQEKERSNSNKDIHSYIDIM